MLGRVYEVLGVQCFSVVILPAGADFGRNLLRACRERSGCAAQLVEVRPLRGCGLVRHDGGFCLASRWSGIVGRIGFRSVGWHSKMGRSHRQAENGWFLILPEMRTQAHIPPPNPGYIKRNAHFSQVNVRNPKLLRRACRSPPS